MRSTNKEAAQNRDKVLKTASTLFRRHGYDGIGIAAIMKAAGMTNGAFYKQFKDKDTLIAEATASALQENLTHWQRVSEDSSGDVLQAMADWYLSAEHIDHPEQGCSFATLASELPRHREDAQNALEQGLLSVLETIGEAAASKDDAIRLLSRLVGALILSRAVQTQETRDKILSANLNV